MRLRRSGKSLFLSLGCQISDTNGFGWRCKIAKKITQRWEKIKKGNGWVQRVSILPFFPSFLLHFCPLPVFQANFKQNSKDLLTWIECPGVQRGSKWSCLVFHGNKMAREQGPGLLQLTYISKHWMNWTLGKHGDLTADVCCFWLWFQGYKFNQSDSIILW